MSFVPSSNQRAAQRYELNAKAHGEIGSTKFQGRIKDVSVSGAAVVGVGDVGYENDQFVGVHMQGIGYREGHVRRMIPDGFALEFKDDDATAKKKLEAAAQMAAIKPRDLIG